MTLPHHHHHHTIWAIWTYYTTGLHSSTTTTTTGSVSSPGWSICVARIDKSSRMRSLHVSDDYGWDGYDDMPVAALPIEFRMPDIERYTGIEGVRGASDRGQMSQSLHSFPVGGEDSTYYDRPSERNQISMIIHSLQARFARHLMGFPQIDFGSLVQALYGIEEGISRGLWANSSPSDSKGKKSGSSPGPQMLAVGSTYLHRHHSRYMLHRHPRGRLCSSIISIEHRLHRDQLDSSQLGMPLSRAFQRLVEETNCPLRLDHHYSLPPRIQDRSSLYLPSESSHDTDSLFSTETCHSGFDRSGPSGAVFLLDNGSALNVCPLVTAIALGFSPDDFGPSTQTVRAYDGTQRTVMGTLSTHVMIGPVSYSIVFQVLRIQSSFNLLGRPWIHEAGAIPSSLHQKVKFIHEGRIITIQSDRDIITSSEPVLHISHSEDDLHLTGFTFDEVQVVSLEDGSRDMVPMSFDQHSSTLVLSMMRGMSYLPEADARYMSQLRRDRGSEHTPRTEGTVHIPETVEIQDIQHLGQIIWTPGLLSTWCHDSSRPITNRASVFSMCFPDEAVSSMPPHGPHTVFDMFGVFVLETDEDDSIPDAYTDDMDFIGIGHILDAAPRGPLSAFDISGVSVLDDESVLDVVTSDFTSVEERPTLWTHLFLLTLCRHPRHIYDVDDVGDTDDPLGGQSECDSDTEDRKVTPISSSTELIDFGAPDQPREIRIGSSLSPDERSRLIDLLRSYLDVFAWSYEDMSGLDPTIVQHHLPILPHARPVKQKLRRLHPRWSLQVKEEIQKQLSVGFLSVVEYPEWLANVVPVPKKDGKVRVCVDFRDLNKASPKDDFPLPHIDMLVDSTAGHPMLSFMDGFSGYNQILMARGYGATYQRAATTLFHDMMHRDVEVYVDDMIVKSRDRADHLAALQRFFERIRQFRLRLNPKKCTFGVTSGKLLGHIVSERGIEVDPEKIRAILDMPTPRTEKEIRGFLGRLQYISRFIARLTDICEPIFRLLRKNQPTVWNDDCQRAFERIKECLLSPPVLVPPTPGRPLLLYLSVSDMALGCMLAQLDDLGKERAIYYLSKRMLEYECKPVLTGRLMRWLVLLTEFDIHYVTQKSVKGSIVADHLASLPISDDRSVDDDFPDEQIVSMTSITGWRLYFDGAANQSGFGIGILLISPQGDHIPRSVRLAFSDHHRLTNNIVEYEACITGLETALDLGIRQLEIPGIPTWAENQFADALATLASLIVIPAGVNVRPLLIETSFCHAALTQVSLGKDRRALRHWPPDLLFARDALYRRSPDACYYYV
ncbi:Retrovirus-related Pol polyprotein from transposon 297 [Vitis vinifera]|uniref:Retrovirus-related Pol polyprotein from transposon 297 n=1 Tax=Vitis vinifera TaxID=29760 RepID=A0A438DJM8_VITVI|nr:Retrovirus-related Pol polyprotein from transposon 297 [Vitis vinifera]